MANRISAIVVTFALALVTVPALHAQTYPTGNDPRNGLKPGMYDAGTAQSGMKLVSFSPKAPELDSVRGLTFINSDVAFRDHYVYQGNFSGFSIWDVKNPSKPVIPTSNGLSYSMNSLPRSACTIGAFSFSASSINSAWAPSHPAPPKMVTFRESLRMLAVLAISSSEGRTVAPISG